MARLIDKDAAYTALKHEEETHELSFTAEAFGKAARIIDQMPTIEAETKRGRWIQRSNGEYYCNNCGREEKFIFQKNYCPRCGADMRGGAENG